MNLNLASLSKIYIFFYGLVSFFHISSLVGFAETIVQAPTSLPIWSWHLTLFLIYGALPIIAVLMNNMFLLAVTGSSAVGMVLEILGVFSMIINLNALLFVLHFFATALSLSLTVENTSARIAAEIISLEETNCPF